MKKLILLGLLVGCTGLPRRRIPNPKKPKVKRSNTIHSKIIRCMDRYFNKGIKISDALIICDKVYRNKPAEEK